MDRVERYRALAPFSMDELVASANALLGDDERLHVTRRTVRFYVSEGKLPPPEGPPKTARYPYDTLVKLLALRQSKGGTIRFETPMLAEAAPRMRVREAAPPERGDLVRRISLAGVVIEIPAEADVEESLGKLRKALDS